MWNVKRLHWAGSRLVTEWTFTTDWKPIPNVVDLLG